MRNFVLKGGHYEVITSGIKEFCSQHEPHLPLRLILMINVPGQDHLLTQ